MDSIVKWMDSICFLMGRGEMEFEEIGSGIVLIGFIYWIKNEVELLIYVFEKKFVLSYLEIFDY